MEQTQLKHELITSLTRLYEIKAFATLSVFLQGETQVLFYLSQHTDKEINPSELSDRLHVSRSRITATLTSLRKKGYIAMELSPEDRRRMRVILTPEGGMHIREKQQQVDAYFEILVEGLGGKNVLELNRIIDLSINIMNRS